MSEPTKVTLEDLKDCIRMLEDTSNTPSDQVWMVSQSLYNAILKRGGPESVKNCIIYKTKP